MCTQPIDDGRGMPQQMTSWVRRVIGLKQPARNDKACAEARGNALKKQREALGKK